MNCSHCGQKGANIDCGDNRWFHKSCFDKMPPNRVFPPNFWRKSAIQTFLDEMKHYIKDGKFTGERK